MSKWFLVFLFWSFVAMAQNSVAIDSRHYVWKPKPDITAYELSLALPALLSGELTAYDALPDNVKRHFEPGE